LCGKYVLANGKVIAVAINELEGKHEMNRRGYAGREK
jgi:hypothetical protein